MYTNGRKLLKVCWGQIIFLGCKSKKNGEVWSPYSNDAIFEDILLKLRLTQTFYSNSMVLNVRYLTRNLNFNRGNSTIAIKIYEEQEEVDLINLMKDDNPKILLAHFVRENYIEKTECSKYFSCFLPICKHKVYQVYKS